MTPAEWWDAHPEEREPRAAHGLGIMLWLLAGVVAGVLLWAVLG